MTSKENNSKKAYYQDKWIKLSSSVDLKSIPKTEEKAIQHLFIHGRMSFQQMKQLINISQKLNMWGAPPLSQWTLPNDHQNLWTNIQNKWEQYISKLPDYQNKKVIKTEKAHLDKLKVQQVERQGKFMKICPAYSDEYVCCGLQVMNVIENCAYACSYCVLHNFYGDREVRITKNLDQKLHQLSTELDPNKLYRIGTGEYSDSLIWGNQNYILDHLVNFAQKNGNVCLELKTKSVNISWLQKHSDHIPKNLIVTWSINPDIIIQHEEHKTPSLNKRLEAARQVADTGILIGFNFHPMVRYEGYQKDYTNLANKITSMFKPHEVILISQGSLSFLKQHQDKLIKNFPHSQLLKSKMEIKGDRKIGYTTQDRIELYRLLNTPLKSWGNRVFRYLCMEGEEVYLKTLGYSYKNNIEFNQSMNHELFKKIRA